MEYIFTKKDKIPYTYPGWWKYIEIYYFECNCVPYFMKTKKIKALQALRYTLLDIKTM
jgi:hypothetical protein